MELLHSPVDEEATSGLDETINRLHGAGPQVRHNGVTIDVGVLDDDIATDRDKRAVKSPGHPDNANTAHASFIGIPSWCFRGPKRVEVNSHRRTLLDPSTLFTVVLAVTLLILRRPGLLPWAALALVGNQVQEP